MPDEKSLIFIPTYNEKENAEKLYFKIASLNIPFDILFIDDNSPDGTGISLDNLAKRFNNVKVIHRPGKMGIGSAHKQGIRYAYQNSYGILITMDCDFTHSPEYIPRFIGYSQDYDVVLGSRFLSSASLVGWSRWRKFLTLAGHTLTRILLGFSYDASGAYRLYNLKKIPREAFDSVISEGYSFFFESLYLLNKRKLNIKEFSIMLPARSSGHSKMDLKAAIKGVSYLFWLWLKNIFRGR